MNGLAYFEEQQLYYKRVHDLKDAIQLWREAACLEFGPHTYVLSVEDGDAYLKCSNCAHDPVTYSDELQMEAIPVTIELHEEHYRGLEADEYSSSIQITPVVR